MNDKNITLNSMNVLLIILLFIIIFIFAFSFILEAESRDFLFIEGGILESLSAFGYALCAFLILLWGRLSYLKKYNYFFIMVVLFGLRELDFHSRFTTMGIFKSRFYISSDVPIAEKIIGLMVIALLLYIIISIVKNHFTNMLSKIKSSSSVHVGALSAFILLAVSKTLDGFARKMSSFDVMISEQVSMHISAMEEVVESTIPVILIFTFYAYFFESRSNKSIQPDAESSAD